LGKRRLHEALQRRDDGRRREARRTGRRPEREAKEKRENPQEYVRRCRR